MNIKENITVILNEIKKCTSEISAQNIERVMDLIISSPKIFVAGAGRSGFSCKGLAMRLMHMGFNAYVPGEVTTPSFNYGDLLIIGSGSGSTGSLVSMAQKAKAKGGKIVLVTISENSPIGNLADVVLTLNADTPKIDAIKESISVQPMGSLFEQSLTIIFDAVIMLLMEKQGLTSAQMFERHANLE